MATKRVKSSILIAAGVLTSLVVLLGALTVSALSYAPFTQSLVEREARAALKESCPACELKIEKLDFEDLFSSLLSSSELSTLTAEKIEYIDNPKAPTVVSLTVQRLQVKFNAASLLKYALFGEGAVQIEKVQADRAHIFLSETENGPRGNPPATPPLGAPLTDFPAAKIDGIVATNGRLTYTFNTARGKKAVIDVYEIDCKLGAFATRAELATGKYGKQLTMNGNGRLEKSGSAAVRVAFEPFAEKNNDTIEIEIAGQRMAELDKFFGIESGIKISGIINHGLAVMKLSQGNLSGALRASYYDLNVKYLENEKRTGIESFLSNAVTALTTAKSRPQQGQKPPIAPISQKRRPYEPVTKLLIRGLLQAAQKILMG